MSYLLNLYVIVAVCLVLAVLCVIAALLYWISKSLGERHRLRFEGREDCDEVYEPDEFGCMRERTAARD